MSLLDEAKKELMESSGISEELQGMVRIEILRQAKRGSRKSSIDVSDWTLGSIGNAASWLRAEGFQVNVRDVKIEVDGWNEVSHILDIAF